MKDLKTCRVQGLRSFSFVSGCRAAIAILMLCVGLTMSAQNMSVSGTVEDSTGEPLMGATVLVSGTAQGVATDLNGNFTIQNVNPNGTLEVSYVGYNSQTVNINGQSNLTIVLTEDSEMLDEVVVVGYGTMKKSDLTGSVSTVGTEKLNAKGAPSVLENLQGTTPGVNITKSTGRANGGIDVQIRGKASINNDTKPIYVVDGVICSDIDFLNPQDIERIDVLKDASSTAIYGSRATGGVIMVTTKGGMGVERDQPATITYDGYYGISKANNLPNFMDAAEYYNYRFMTFSNSFNALASYTPNLQPQTIYGMLRGEGGLGQALIQSQKTVWDSPYVLKEMMARGENYDWPSLVLRDAHQQNHYLGVNGATKTTSYHFGIGINDEDGLYHGDGSTTYSFKGSVDTRINKVISAGFTVNMAYQEKEYANSSAIQQAWRTNPFCIPYNEDGEINVFPGNCYGTDGNNFTNAVSPLLMMKNAYQQRKIYRMIGNAYLQLDLLKGLNVKTTFSPSYQTYRDGSYTGYANPEQPGYSYANVSLDSTSDATVTNFTSMGWIWDNVISYQNTFAKDHSVNVMGLFSMENSNSETYKWVSTGVLQGTEWYNMGSGETDNSNSSSSYSKGTMISYAFRANYSYKGRYMATATVRWDGSSKLAEGHKWASFPSVAVAWRLSEESFLKKYEWLSNAKLRLAYGVTGNNSGVKNYGTILSIGGPVYYPWGNSYNQGYYANGIVDNSLTWERSNEFNVGLDFGFLNNRISGTIDWYNKRSHGLLFPVQLPLETGGVTMSTNVGKVQNTGIEVALTTVNIENRNWNWTTSFTFAHNKNNILKLTGDVDQIVKGTGVGNLFVGHPVNNVFNYVWDGIVTDKLIKVPDNQAAVDHGFVPGESVRSCDYYYAVYGLSEGRPIVRDVTGDGVINEDDRVIHSSEPNWTGSFTSNLSYKLPKKGGALDFSFSIYSRQGGKIYSPFMNGDFFKLGDRGWQKINVDFYVPTGAVVDADGMRDDGTYINPVFQTETHYGSWPYPNNYESGVGSTISPSSYWAEARKTVSASYVKVKNITLGYTFDKSILKHIGCKNARIYVTVTNPFVFSKYLGFDPEWADAADKNDGPSTVTYQIGASIKF